MLGKTVGNYKIEKELGHGGMGEVYLGKHVHTGKPGAVKIIHYSYSSDSRFIERFKREAGALQDLNHPNIVRIHDFIQSPQGAAVAMEYVDGWSL